MTRRARREELLAVIARLYHRLDKTPSGCYSRTRAPLGPARIVAKIRALSEEHWRLADPDTIGHLAFCKQGRKPL